MVALSAARGSSSIEPDGSELQVVPASLAIHSGPSWYLNAIGGSSALAVPYHGKGSCNPLDVSAVPSHELIAHPTVTLDAQLPQGRSLRVALVSLQVPAC